MEFEYLVSTMDQKDIFFIENMNIRGNALIINQCNHSEIKISIKDKNIRMLSFVERGLSKSRNRAIENATGDICLISDDDMWYYDGIEKKILEIARNHPDVSVFIFKVDNHKKNYPNRIKKMGFVDILKVSSVQIAFNKRKIYDSNIKFLENFGAGSGKYLSGEENIFLKDCLEKGLKIYYFPLTIGKLRNSESTWFTGYNEKFFKDKGAVFYELSHRLWLLMIFLFAIKKYKIYRNNLGIVNVIKYMIKGAIQYRSIKQKEGKQL